MATESEDEDGLIIMALGLLALGVIMLWGQMTNVTFQYEYIRGGWLVALLYNDIGILVSFIVGAALLYFGR